MVVPGHSTDYSRCLCNFVRYLTLLELAGISCIILDRVWSKVLAAAQASFCLFLGGLLSCMWTGCWHFMAWDGPGVLAAFGWGYLG